MGILVRFQKSKIILAFAFYIALLVPAWAQNEGQLRLYEQKIKAGLIYNFLKYTTWPNDAHITENGQLNLCILGSDSFDGYLSPLQGKTAQQSVIVIKQIARVAEAGSCNMVFINEDQAQNLPELLNFLSGKHILTVSDINRFTHQGGMVELVKEGDKINLYINKTAVSQSGLNIQDRLLKLAKIVRG